MKIRSNKNTRKINERQQQMPDKMSIRLKIAVHVRGQSTFACMAPIVSRVIPDSSFYLPPRIRFARAKTKFLGARATRT